MVMARRIVTYAGARNGCKIYSGNFRGREQLGGKRVRWTFKRNRPAEGMDVGRLCLMRICIYTSCAIKA